MQKVQWKVNYIANICTAGTCEDLYLSKYRRYFHRDNKRTLWAYKFHQLKHKPYLQSEGHKSVKKKLFLYYYLIFFRILDIFTDLSFEIFVITYSNQILQHFHLKSNPNMKSLIPKT